MVRTALVPPLDVSQFPSPLPGFRRYTEPNTAALYDKVVLRVDGLPTGSLVRFATLDAYDGLVWGAADRSTDGVPFQQVGSRIAPSGGGTPVDVTVDVVSGGYAGYWLPTVGAPTRIEFTGPRSDELSSQLWLNTDTDTAVVPARLLGGERYTTSALVPPGGPPSCRRTSTWPAAPPPRRTSTCSTPASTPGPAGPRGPGASCVRSPARCAPRAPTPTAAPPTASRRSTCPGTRPPGSAGSSTPPSSPATTSSTPPPWRWPGSGSASRHGWSWVPSRRRTARCAVANVHAWVEVQLDDGSWFPLRAATFVPSRDKTPSEQQLKSEEQKVGAQVPPPAGVNPPSLLQGPDQVQNATDIAKRKKSPFSSN